MRPTAASTASRRLTSAGTTRISAPAARQSRASASRRSARRAVTATRAPRRMSSGTRASPIPELAPVSQTRAFRSSMLVWIRRRAASNRFRARPGNIPPAPGVLLHTQHTCLAGGVAQGFSPRVAGQDGSPAPHPSTGRKSCGAGPQPARVRAALKSRPTSSTDASRGARADQGRTFFVHIAVVGLGISGLAAAWLLGRAHRVDVFDREPRAGGHAHTHAVHDGDATWPVDTGFMVYNERTYPNFVRLLEALRVETRPSDMSFGVRCRRCRLEYSSRGLRGLFAQPWRLRTRGTCACWATCSGSSGPVGRS